MSITNLDTQRLATLQRQWSVKCSDLIELYKLYIQAEFHYYKHLRKNLLLKLRILGLPYQISKQKALELREYYQQRVALLEEQLAWLKKQQLHFPGVGVAHDQLLQQNLDARIYNYYLLKQRELPYQTHSRLLSSKYYLLGEIQHFYADLWLQGYVPCWAGLLNLMHELWLPHLSDHEVEAWVSKIQQVACQAQALRSEAVQAKIAYAQEQLNIVTSSTITTNAELDLVEVQISQESAAYHTTAEQAQTVTTFKDSHSSDAVELDTAQASHERHNSAEKEAALYTEFPTDLTDTSTEIIAQEETVLAQDLWSLFADFAIESDVEVAHAPIMAVTMNADVIDTSRKVLLQQSLDATQATVLEQGANMVGNAQLSVQDSALGAHFGLTRERELWHQVYTFSQHYTLAELLQLWSGVDLATVNGINPVSGDNTVTPSNIASQIESTPTQQTPWFLGDALWQSWNSKFLGSINSAGQASELPAPLGVEHFYLRALWNRWGIDEHTLVKATPEQQLHHQHLKLDIVTSKLENFIARTQLYLAQAELNFNRPISAHKTQLLATENNELAQQLTATPHLTIQPWESPFTPAVCTTDVSQASEEFVSQTVQVTLEELMHVEDEKVSNANVSPVASTQHESHSATSSTSPLRIELIRNISNFLPAHVNLSELEQLGNHNIYGQLERLLQEHWDAFLQRLEQQGVHSSSVVTAQLRQQNTSRLQRLHQAVAQLLVAEPQEIRIGLQELHLEVAEEKSNSNFKTSASIDTTPLQLPWSLERTLGIISWSLRTLGQLYPQLTSSPEQFGKKSTSARKRKAPTTSTSSSPAQADNTHRDASILGVNLPAPLIWVQELALLWWKQLGLQVLQQMLEQLASYKWVAAEQLQVWSVLLSAQQSQGVSSSLDECTQTQLRSLYVVLQLLQIQLGTVVTVAQLARSIQQHAHQLLCDNASYPDHELQDYSLKDSARNLRTGKYAAGNLRWSNSLFELFGEELVVQQAQSATVSTTQHQSELLNSQSDYSIGINFSSQTDLKSEQKEYGSGIARDAAVGDAWHVTDARREKVDYALARYLTRHTMQASAQCARVPYHADSIAKPFARYGVLSELNNLVGINLGSEIVPIPELHTERMTRAQHEARIAQSVQPGHLTYLEEARDTVAYLVDVTVTIPPVVTQAKFKQFAHQHYQRYLASHSSETALSLQEVLATCKSQDATHSEFNIDLHHPYVFKFRVRVSREVLLPDHTSFNLNTRLFASPLYQNFMGMDLYHIERGIRMRGMLPGLRTYGEEVKPLTRMQLEQMLIEIAYAQAQRQLAQASLEQGNPHQLLVDAETGEAMPQLDLTQLPQPQILLEQVNAWDGKGKPINSASLPPTLKALWLQAGELARNYALGVTGYEPQTSQAQDVACVDFTKVTYQPNNYYLNSPQGQQELYLALALAERVSELFAQQEATQGITSSNLEEQESEIDLSLTPTQALEQLRRFVTLHREILIAQLGQTRSRANNYSCLGYFDRLGHWQHVIKPQFLLELIFHPASYRLLYELRQQQQQQREQMRLEQLREQQQQAQAYRAQWLPPELQRDSDTVILPGADPLFRSSKSEVFTRVGVTSSELLSASEAESLVSEVTEALQRPASRVGNQRQKVQAQLIPEQNSSHTRQQASLQVIPSDNAVNGTVQRTNAAPLDHDNFAQDDSAPLRARFKGRSFSAQLRQIEQRQVAQAQLRQVAIERGGMVAHPSQQLELQQRLEQQKQALQQRLTFPSKLLQPVFPTLEQLWQERTFKDWGEGIIRPPSFKLILQIEEQRRVQLQNLRQGWRVGTPLGSEEIEPSLLLDPRQTYPSYEQIPREYPRPPEIIRSYEQQVQNWYANQEPVATSQAVATQCIPEALYADSEIRERSLSLAPLATRAENDNVGANHQADVVPEQLSIDLEQAQVWGDMVVLPLEAMLLSPQQQAELAEQKLQSLRVSKLGAEISKDHAQDGAIATSATSNRGEHADELQFNKQFGQVWAGEFRKSKQVVSARGALNYLRELTAHIAELRVATDREIYQHDLPPVTGFPVSGGKVQLKNGQVTHVIPGTLLTPQLESLVRAAEHANYVASFPIDAQAEFAIETITRIQAEQRVYATPENNFASLEASQQRVLQDFVARDLPTLISDLDLDEGTSLEALVASLEMQGGQLYQRDITSQLLESYDVRKLRPTTERVIFHCDINNCYASIEQHLNPELKGKPIAVTGNVEDRHGIVLAKSNQAKKYGIKTGDTVHQAKQKCPHLICVPPHSDIYKQFSHRAHQIYACYTDMIESFGIDEVWLDVTDVVHHYESPVHLAHLIRKRIHQELGITISVGVSFNKVFAKLGSDLKKPNAVTEINYYNYEKLLYPLAIEEMVGIGRSTRTALQKSGIYTIGDLARADFNMIAQRFGYGGKIAWINANGLNFAAVAHMHDRPKEKSIGHGLTFKEDLISYQEVYAAFQELALDVAHRLLKARKYARAIQISVRDKDLNTRQFQAPLKQPSYSALEFARLASSLFQAHVTEPFAIRQLTIRAINLIYQAEIDEFPDFEGLFNADTEHERNLRMQETLMMVREKFGKQSMNFASSLLNTKVGNRNTIPFADKIVHAEKKYLDDETWVERSDYDNYV